MSRRCAVPRRRCARRCRRSSRSSTHTASPLRRGPAPPPRSRSMCRLPCPAASLRCNGRWPCSSWSRRQSRCRRRRDVRCTRGRSPRTARGRCHSMCAPYSTDTASRLSVRASDCPGRPPIPWRALWRRCPRPHSIPLPPSPRWRRGLSSPICSRRGLRSLSAIPCCTPIPRPRCCLSARRIFVRREWDRGRRRTSAICRASVRASAAHPPRSCLSQAPMSGRRRCSASPTCRRRRRCRASARRPRNTA